MFSKREKQVIAQIVEDALIAIDHPEMPKEKPRFKLHIDGKESWSYADIEPNWLYEEKGSPDNPNPWNEKARGILNEAQEKD